MRSTVVILMFACALLPLTGCTTGPDGSAAQPPAGFSSTAPAHTYADTAVMAIVNGQPIYMSQLNALLVGEFGFAMSQHLVADEVVRQESQALKVTVNDADIQAENDAVLRRALPSAPQSPAERERLLTQLQGQFGVSPRIWDIVMRRQALLRKIAVTKINITEQELRSEFDDQYGKQVFIRDIQVATITDAERLLKELVAEKDPSALEAKFISLAKKNSAGPTAASGGMLPVITKNGNNVHPVIRNAAMAMTEVGAVSPIVANGTSFHILYLVGREDPKNVKFEDVKDRLHKLIEERQVATLQQQILGQLIENARKSGRLTYVHPVLKAEADKAMAPQPK